MQRVYLKFNVKDVPRSFTRFARKTRTGDNRARFSKKPGAVS